MKVYSNTGVIHLVYFVFKSVAQSWEIAWLETCNCIALNINGMIDFKMTKKFSFFFLNFA